MPPKASGEYQACQALCAQDASQMQPNTILQARPLEVPAGKPDSGII